MGLLVGFLGIVLAFAVPLWLGGRAEEKRLGVLRWWRKRYLRSLVSAVRTGGAVGDTMMLTWIVMLIPVAGGLAVYGLNVSLRSSAADARRLLEESERPDIEKMSKEELEQEKARLQEEKGRRLREVRDNVSQSGLVIGVGWSIVVALYAVALYAVFCWQPFVMLRREFAFAVGRYTARLQGLATKGELNELIKAECEVRDVASLRAYVEAMRKIAERHDAHDLASMWDKWINWSEVKS